MKLSLYKAAQWRRAVEAWFDEPGQRALRLKCPSCQVRLRIEDWRQLSTPFVQRETMVCSTCDNETVLRDDWIQ
jgi:hypothetical protein